MLRILKGQPSVVHVHMKRRAMSELPETDEEVSQWCKDIFVDKGFCSFDGEVKHLGRPIKSLLVVIFWSSVLSYAIFRFFKWTQFLPTFKGVLFTSFGLVLVTVCMQILVQFSQAEKSSAAKAARN
ncbi:hypothetical protein LUZ60_006024 [Juncus effusus]|nr:hypothetical protein LUZ60_006024 [Juncus effusus]